VGGLFLMSEVPLYLSIRAKKAKSLVGLRVYVCESAARECESVCESV